MLICEDCGALYNEIPEDNQCKCGGRLTEAKQCPICQTHYIDEQDEMCEECKDKNSTIENVLAIGNKYDVEMNINGFWYSVFSKDEIEQCLLNCFNELPSHIKNKYIKDYVDEDVYCLLEILKENK
jgi:RecJ-like exonuclease